jgi:hypothetical protein
MLRAALVGWQEGPTDGRVCLDPRVLPTDTATVTARPVWADAVLAALLTDTLVALDSTAVPTRDTGRRACAPTRGHPRISIGLPSERGDSVDIETEGRDPAAGAAMRTKLVLGRVNGRWVIVRSAGQPLQRVPPST